MTDAEYLRDLADGADTFPYSERLNDIADNIERDHWKMLEIRSLVRPIIQNAPQILEHATDD